VSEDLEAEDLCGLGFDHGTPSLAPLKHHALLITQPNTGDTRRDSSTTADASIDPGEINGC
jgi:hypothetical protein